VLVDQKMTFVLFLKSKEVFRKNQKFSKISDFVMRWQNSKIIFTT